MGSWRIGAALGFTMLATVGSAQAASRTVSPAGSGTACSAAAPCALTQGVTGAASGDDVFVGSGAYTLSTALTIAAGVRVHGTDGQPRPTLAASGAGALDILGRLAGINVTSTTAAPVMTIEDGGLAEGLIVRGGGGNYLVRVGAGSLLRDSVVRATGISDAVGYTGYNGRFDLVGDTIIATGASSYALYFNANTAPPPFASVAVVHDTILRGVGADVAVLGAATQQVLIDHSDYRVGAFLVGGANVVAGAGNIVTDPTLFDGASGDLRQRTGSPTIDAGTPSSLDGSVDIDGQPRTVGSNPDIGADEHPGPPGIPPALPSGNLLVNPGAEASAGAADAVTQPPVPGWTTTAGFTVVKYGVLGFPKLEESLRVRGGLNVFAGGPATATATATQAVDVTASASAIDAGQATTTLGAELGGFDAQEDGTSVTATFRDATGASLGAVTIGPAGAGDRGAETILVHRVTSVPTPPSTRRIDVVMTALNLGVATQYDNGYADNLSLTLQVPAPVVPITPPDITGPVLTRPAITAFGAHPRSFRRRLRGRPATGTTTSLTFSLSEAATVRMVFERSSAGRIAKGRCVRPRSKPRGARCTRWTATGTLSHSGVAGPNVIPFSGLVKDRRLTPGSYRVTLTATNVAGATSSSVVATFTIQR